MPTPAPLRSPLAALTLLAAAAAQADPPPPADPVPLTVGDAAPPLAATHWLKGEEVTAFARDRVYVLEFWATTCGPCIGAMEHLSELQERHAEDVTFVGLSREPLAEIVSFLFRRLPDGRQMNDRVRYALATDPDGSAWNDYVVGSAAAGIPATFLIGRDGHIEWTGLPGDLEGPLQQVLDGTWDRAAHRAAALAEARANLAVHRLNAELRDAKAAGDWERALRALDVLIARDGKGSLRAPTKLRWLLGEVKDRERARAYAAALAQEAWDDDEWTLMQIAWAMTEAPAETADLDLARRAAARAVELTNGTDDDHLAILARVHHLRGEHAEAVRHLRAALALVRADRPEVPPEELPGYEAWLEKLEARLREYEAALGRR